MAIGGAVGDLDGTGRGAEALDQFAGLFVDARGVGVAGGEDDVGRLFQQLDELGGRLDRGEVEGARAAWDQHQVGDFDRGAGGAVGMGRRVDDDELGALALGRGDLGGEARGWAVDHLGRRIAAPGGPLARGRLRVGVDDERDAPRILGGRGEVDGERRLPRPPFWLMIAMTGMITTLHVDMATWQVVDMSNQVNLPHLADGPPPVTACSF